MISEDQVPDDDLCTFGYLTGVKEKGKNERQIMVVSGCGILVQEVLKIARHLGRCLSREGVNSRPVDGICPSIVSERDKISRGLFDSVGLGKLPKAGRKRGLGLLFLHRLPR